MVLRIRYDKSIDTLLRDYYLLGNDINKTVLITLMNQSKRGR
jgi:hypothetical protein